MKNNQNNQNNQNNNKTRTSIIYDDSKQKNETALLQQQPVQYVNTSPNTHINNANRAHQVVTGQKTQGIVQNPVVQPAVQLISTATNPTTQYVQSTTQYVQPSTQYVQPSTQYVYQTPNLQAQNYFVQAPMTQSYIVAEQPVETQQVYVQKPVEIIKEKIIHVERPNQEYEILIENLRRQNLNLTASLDERNSVIEQQRVKIAQMEVQYQQNYNNVQIVRDLESRVNFLNRENQTLIQNKESLLGAIVELESRCNQITDDALNIEREKRSGNEKTFTLQQEINHLNELLRQRDSEIILTKQRMSQLEAIEIRYKQQLDDISRLTYALDQKERERIDLQQNLAHHNQFAYESENLRIELNKLAKVIQAKDQECYILSEKLRSFDVIQIDKVRMEDDIRRLAIIVEQKEKEIQRLSLEITQFRTTREDPSQTNFLILERDRQLDDLRVRIQVLLNENSQLKSENEKVIVLAQELDKTNQILQNCMVEKDNYKFQLEQNRGSSSVIQEYEDRIRRLVDEIESLQKKSTYRYSLSAATANLLRNSNTIHKAFK